MGHVSDGQLDLVQLKLGDLETELTEVIWFMKLIYDTRFQRIGENFAQGDHLARNQLKVLIVRFRSGIASHLEYAYQEDAAVNTEMMLSISMKLDDQVYSCVRELANRLRQSAQSQDRDLPSKNEDNLTGISASQTADERPLSYMAHIPSRPDAHRTLPSSRQSLNESLIGDTLDIATANSEVADSDDRFRRTASSVAFNPWMEEADFPSRDSVTLPSTNRSTQSRHFAVTARNDRKMSGPQPIRDASRSMMKYRSSVDPGSPLKAAIKAGDSRKLAALVGSNLDEVAKGEYLWLKEMADLGYSPAEIADLLLDVDQNAPWIYFEQDERWHDSYGQSEINEDHHTESCAHEKPSHLNAGGVTSHAKEHTTGLAYNKNDLSLRNEDICRKIAASCGLGGIKPISKSLDAVVLQTFVSPNLMSLWVQQTKFEEFDQLVASVSYSIPERSNLIHAIPTMASILIDLHRILVWLQAMKLCCNSFTALVMLPHSAVIKMIRVEFRLIEPLVILLHGYASVPESFAVALEALEKEVDHIINLILGKEFEIEEDRTNYAVWAGGSAALHRCSLAVQMLCLTLLSYSSAHLGDLQPFFLDRAVNKVHLHGSKIVDSPPEVVLEPLLLTCLDDMVRKRVLVFHSRHARTYPTSRHHLLASPEDIVDTWGPGVYVRQFTESSSFSPNWHKLCAIEIGCGTICPAQIPEQLHFVKGRVPYGSITTSFDRRQEILIGAIQINKKCPLDEQQSRKMCEDFLMHLGTSANSFEVAQRQLTVQGGQYINVQYSQTWNKKTGVTVKDSILDSLAGMRAQKSELQTWWALQVSLCTGLTRRVSLLELLSDMTDTFIQNRVPLPPTWRILTETHHIAKKFICADFWDWYERQLDHELQIAVIEIIGYVLHALSTTGVDESKQPAELVIAWATEQDPFKCVRVRCNQNNSWARILADSEDCATFAYMTTKWFETSTHKCGNKAARVWINETASLDTAVSRHCQPGDAPGWSWTHNATYWIGKQGTDLVAKLVLSAADTSETRLSVNHSSLPPHIRRRLPFGRPMFRIREPESVSDQSKKVLVLTV